MASVSHMALAASYVSGLPDVEYSYLGAETSTSSSAPSYTFNYSSLVQPENASRRFIGVFCFDSATNSPTVSGITVDGVAATLHVNRMDAYGTREKGLCIFSCAKPTGTSAAVVVTFSQTAAVSYVMRAYAAININSGAPLGTVSEFDEDVTSLGGSIATEDGGIIIAGGHGLSAVGETLPAATGFTIDSVLRSTSATGFAQLAGSYLATSTEASRALNTTPWYNSITGPSPHVQFAAVSFR